ncbi:MAG: iron ABC transporter [Planctomycetaceae bacterium]|nr:iron ABC transporter [Planctomycetaceae bacterium]
MGFPARVGRATRDGRHTSRRSVAQLWLSTLLVAWTASATPAQQPVNHDHTRASQPSSEPSGASSLADNRFAWPSMSDIKRVLWMQDYNTRIVLWGTTTLGLAAGIAGTFLLLRKRSLLGDVVGHASLPGVAIAFLVMESGQPGNGKWLPGLLLGASIAGVAGMASTVAIRSLTRIKEDAALAITLGSFYGLGIVLFTIIQDLPTGSQAGLANFIYGSAASINQGDVGLIWRVAIVAILAAGLLFKEFGLLCFDERFAASQGWPVVLIDLILMGLVVAVCVIGLRSVGLLLVVALLIIPAAAARFWTDKLSRMTLCAAAIGVISCYVGAASSALFSRLAAGAVIVLAGSALFCVSLFVGTRRGVLVQWYTRRQLNRRIAAQHLLLAFFEIIESRAIPGSPLPSADSAVKFDELLSRRSWPASRLLDSVRIALATAVLESLSDRVYRLTALGQVAARRAARNYRLWELYLLEHADVAPAQVDRDAEQIEHVLDRTTIAELDVLLFKKYPQMDPGQPDPAPPGNRPGLLS